MLKSDQNNFNTLIYNSKVLISDNNGPKVLKLTNGNCLKFFRLKKWLSSAFFYHYADRFSDNAIKLANLEIASIIIVNKYKIPNGYIKYSKLTKAIEYKYLTGSSLRDVIAANKLSINNTQDSELASDLGKFIAKLHNVGIYFRANHFGNIIYNPKLPDKFGLIDIENTKFYNKPLSIKKRQRNFKQMTRYDIDKNWLNTHKDIFLNNYFKFSINCPKFNICLI